MKSKQDIVDNWLPRYTGVPLDGFGQHILLTNFGGYLAHFSAMTGAPIVGLDRPMPSATFDGITPVSYTHLDVYKRQVQWGWDDGTSVQQIRKYETRRVRRRGRC